MKRGVLNPIDKISKIVHSAGAYFHSDATQFVGRQSFDMNELGVDLVTFSGHKIYGPSGVGALIGNRNIVRNLQPIIHGGDQERGLRSGSMNTAGIVGFGEAAKIAANCRISEAKQTSKLRDYLVNSLKSHIPNIIENGDASKRLPNTTNIRFIGAIAEAAIINIDPVAVSAGSACSSGSIEPSHVLLAMGHSHEAASESIRFSLGRFTTLEEIDCAVKKTIEAISFVRSMNREIA